MADASPIEPWIRGLTSNESVIDLVVEVNSSTSSSSSLGKDAFSLALERDFGVEALRILLDIFSREEIPIVEFLYASIEAYSNEATVELLARLSDEEILVDVSPSSLIEACAGGYTYIIEIILNRGLHEALLARDDEHGTTPLMVAIEAASMDIFNLIWPHYVGDTLSWTGVNGMTILHYAAAGVDSYYVDTRPEYRYIIEKILERIDLRGYKDQDGRLPVDLVPEGSSYDEIRGRLETPPQQQ